MSIVRREGKKKRKQVKIATVVSNCTNAVTGNESRMQRNEDTSKSRSACNQQILNGISGTVSFLFTKTGCRLDVSVVRLLEKSSPGWLQSALPDAVGEVVRIPEDSPLCCAGQVTAFQLILQNMSPPTTSLSDLFSGKRLRLLPYAFLAAHMLGLEQVVGETRGIYLKSPLLLLRSLRPRRGDFDTLQRAVDLGFSRINAPLKCGVCEQLQAAETVLHLTSGSGGLLLGAGQKLNDLYPLRWLHVFQVAEELRFKEMKIQLRRLISKPGVMLSMVMALDDGPDVEALCFGVQRGLDAECGESFLHVAAKQGLLKLVEVLAGSGQSINSLSKAFGESPAMLAASGGHLNVLRWLVRERADLRIRSHAGLTALQYASRNGQGSIARWLENPLTHCM